MTDQELAELPRYTWRESRLPALDALCAFVADAAAPDPVVAEMLERTGSSRWYPVQGGHRVLVPFLGGSYDPSRFTLESGAWDHEHCDECGEHVPAMALCHVTEPGQPYVMLCVRCYQQHVATKQQRPWWRFW